MNRLKCYAEGYSRVNRRYVSNEYQPIRGESRKMNTTALIIIGIVVLILLFVAFKIIRSCLPKIIVLGILAVLAYLAYTYLVR